MSKDIRIFWVGLAAYAFSFFLLAVASTPPGSAVPGFFAAVDALWLPFDSIFKPANAGIFEGRLLECTSLLVSGLINPVFLAAAFLKLTCLYPRTVLVLKILVLLMIPFCWIFFAITREGLYPREGHFVWLLGMLSVLFSERLSLLSLQRDTA